MKSILFILTLLPIMAFAQSNDSVVVYQGNGSFENKIIDLSNKNISEIPASAGNLQTEVLILDNNNLTALPDWLSNLKNLRSLSVRGNNLKDVNVLMYCENLEELYLSNNQNLADLPVLSPCKKLKIIDVIDTRINDLPISIRGMENLAYFKYSVKK